jgi:hypothetical protein
MASGSYITIQEAVEYFKDRIFSEVWDNADPIDRQKAIVTATRQIDRHPLKGRKANPDQTLQFPRAFVTGSLERRERRFDLGPTNGWAQETVPQEVKDACCEQAIFLLAQTEYERDRARQNVYGILEEGVGTAIDTMDLMAVRQNRRRTILCPEARELLLPYLIGVTGIR